jgi:hypothetical protein
VKKCTWTYPPTAEWRKEGIARLSIDCDPGVPVWSYKLNLAAHPNLFPPLSFSMFVNSSMMDFLETYRYHALAALFIGCVLFRQLKKGKTSNPRGLPLPPGPKGYPLIGNIFDIPVEKPWLVYKDWCKIYGEFLMIRWPFVATTI